MENLSDRKQSIDFRGFDRSAGIRQPHTADARLARRAHLAPRRLVFREAGDVGHVARFRVRGPLFDGAEGAPRERRLGTRSEFAEPN